MKNSRGRSGWSRLYSDCAARREPRCNGALSMRRTRLLLTLFAVVAVTVAAGCGGDDGSESVPDDAIAVVGEESILKSEFNEVLAQAKKTYSTQNRKFPSARTREYDALKNQFVQYLVQSEQ